MVKWTKRISLILALAIGLNTVSVGVSFADNNSSVTNDTYSLAAVENIIVEDQHDMEMKAAYAALAEENKNRISSSNEMKAATGTIIRRLVEIVFKNVSKGSRVTAKATPRNIITEVSAHAVERAVERGISSLQMDNVLSEKSSGMFAVEKYYDTLNNNSRIMLDRNNKVVIVIDNLLNTIITTYKLDSVSTVDSRIKDGRWVKGSFKYK
ncbi:DUF4258 domain-containing protein [Paenibacillus jiagnxiensis]|uniref:DUF4258 domain-containing protein n=1 Tax=Paenibacillus jiagnxiensis TaxID=3228926 RepID=UPI0033B76F0C